MSSGGASSSSSSTSSTDRNASVFVAGADHRATTTWSLEPEKTEVTMVDDEVVLAEMGIEQLREGGNRKSDEEMKLFALECNVYEYFSFKCKKGG